MSNRGFPALYDDVIFEYKAASPLPQKMQRSVISRPTLYLLYIIFISTIGPLQFGYHLVKIAPYSRRHPRLTYARANSMLLSESSPARISCS